MVSIVLLRARNEEPLKRSKLNHRAETAVLMRSLRETEKVVLMEKLPATTTARGC